MKLDYGRTKDLEMLAEGIKQARTLGEKQYLEKIAYRIMNESTTIKSLRQDLIRAFKVRDMSKVKRLQDQMNKVRLDETNGASWGQQKGERKVYG